MAITLTGSGIVFPDGSSMTTSSMVKSIQTIFLNLSPLVSAGGEYTNGGYFDTTVAAVTNTSKCVFHFYPSSLQGNVGLIIALSSEYGGTSYYQTSLSFVNNTTVRFSVPVSTYRYWSVSGKMTIIEYA